MTCEACIVAETNPKSGLYTGNCTECQARAIAGGPEAWKAAHAQSAVPLQDAIERVFGLDGYEEGRRKVWAWMKRLGVVG